MNMPMSENRYRLVMWIPPVVLLSFLAWGFVREWIARQNVQARIAELASEDVPTTNVARMNLLDAATSREQSAAWSDLFEASDALSNLKRDRVKQEDELVPPGEPWAAEAFAKAVSEKAQPVLDELDRLLEQDDLVWQPFAIDSFWYWAPSLQNLRTISDLLADEFRLAVHSGDNELALRLLKQHNEMRQRFDWPVERAIYMQAHLRERLNLLIRGSVSFDFWTSEQLAEIQKMLADSLNEELSVSNEQAIAMAEFLGPLNAEQGGLIFMPPSAGLRETYPFGISPMHAEMALELMEGIDPREPENRTSDVREPSSKISRPKRYQLADRHRSWVSVPMATMSRQMIQYWDGLRTNPSDRRNINDSRWTITAVAIRRFWKAEERFPKSLDELTSVGLTRQSWTLTFAGPMGYRIEDDGQWAGLWTYYPTDEKNGMQVPSIPRSDYRTTDFRNESFEVWFDRPF